MIGRMRGELPSSGLDGLRSVGAVAYSLAEDAEHVRLEPAWDPWQPDPGTHLFVVCAWNAYALQTVADHMLDADDRADPATAGRLPPATLAFAQACYSAVTPWVEAARFAQANPDYRVRTPLPASLPPWPHIEPTRDVHLIALQDAHDAIAPQAEYELTRLVESAHGAQARDLAEINLLVAGMHTAADVCAGLRANAHSHEQLREACDQLVQAVGIAYTLGQLVAMPTLVQRVRLAGYRAHPSDDVPLTAISTGWLVVDRDDKPVGTVLRLEGEPSLGTVTGVVVSSSVQSRERRVRSDQIHKVETGLVRLRVRNDELV
jgi:hypothetical protein